MNYSVSQWTGERMRESVCFCLLREMKKHDGIHRGDGNEYEWGFVSNRRELKTLRCFAFAAWIFHTRTRLVYRFPFGTNAIQSVHHTFSLSFSHRHAHSLICYVKWKELSQCQMEEMKWCSNFFFLFFSLLLPHLYRAQCVVFACFCALHLLLLAPQKDETVITLPMMPNVRATLR